jgi:hypothetical protein
MKMNRRKETTTPATTPLPRMTLYHIPADLADVLIYDVARRTYAKHEMHTEMARAVDWELQPRGRIRHRMLRAQPAVGGDRSAAVPVRVAEMGDPVRVVERAVAVGATVKTTEFAAEWLGLGVAELCDRGAPLADVIAAAVTADAADLGAVVTRYTQMVAVLQGVVARAAVLGVPMAGPTCYAMARVTAETFAGMSGRGIRPPVGVTIVYHGGVLGGSISRLALVGETPPGSVRPRPGGLSICRPPGL